MRFESGEKGVVGLDMLVWELDDRTGQREGTNEQRTARKVPKWVPTVSETTKKRLPDGEGKRKISGKKVNQGPTKGGDRKGGNSPNLERQIKEGQTKKSQETAVMCGIFQLEVRRGLSLTEEVCTREEKDLLKVRG